MLQRYGMAAYNDGFHVYTTVSSHATTGSRRYTIYAYDRVQVHSALVGPAFDVSQEVDVERDRGRALVFFVRQADDFKLRIFTHEPFVKSAARTVDAGVRAVCRVSADVGVVGAVAGAVAGDLRVGGQRCGKSSLGSLKAGFLFT